MPLPTQQRLNDHLMRWDREIKEFDAAITAYGARKADLEYRRAVVMETAKHQEQKLSQAAAERMADADSEAHRLHKEFRAAESTVEAKKARLRWCAAVADALRSEVATERAERQLYADHGSDA
jgi:chromosome segregation ATPase